MAVKLGPISLLYAGTGTFAERTTLPVQAAIKIDDDVPPAVYFQRSVGSGNVGATNAMRAAGKGAGVLALLLDVAKGVAAVLIAFEHGRVGHKAGHATAEGTGHWT